MGNGASREVREKATGMDNDGRAGGPAPYSRSGRRARCERRAAPWHAARTARAAAAKVRKLSRQTDSFAYRYFCACIHPLGRSAPASPRPRPRTAYGFIIKVERGEVFES